METKLRTQSYIKRRDPYICNIKAFLIFLVVFGHAIEPYIDRPEINIIYRIIYAFHMPLFVFTLVHGGNALCRQQVFQTGMQS